MMVSPAIARPLPPNESRAAYPVITHSIFTPLAVVVVAFRCFARFMSTGFKLDDYLILVALATAIANFPFAVIGARHGIGRHAVYLDLRDITTAVRTLVIGEFLLLLSLCFVKVSVLIFLLGFGGVRKWLKWLLYANILLISSSTLAFSVVIWFQCRPVEANWDPTVAGAKCISIQSFMNAVYILTAITILTDFLCVVLPIPIVWNLHLDRKTKLGITAVMALGLIAAASSIVRIALVKDLRHSREDPTWALVNIGVWTLIELHIAIIVASLPPGRALAVRLWAQVRGKPLRDRYGYGSSGNSKKRSHNSGYSNAERVNKDQDGWIRMDRINLGDTES